MWLRIKEQLLQVAWHFYPHGMRLSIIWNRKMHYHVSQYLIFNGRAMLNFIKFGMQHFNSSMSSDTHDRNTIKVMITCSMLSHNLLNNTYFSNVHDPREMFQYLALCLDILHAQSSLSLQLESWACKFLKGEDKHDNYGIHVMLYMP